ncbi:electron transport complex subunit RsxC [Vibrio sp. SCSIO 43136]|uniref:electron transport complex subunit RsxC n=1 Tax=Vibrio sp. SCSIO 43136 TaxID=2819101 RepID=UPI0020755309|nr:electron transport complex subunit RsxC [Vibrio sp. SCSIO 43136]USD66102.1 electron transport complex subunit RsxC [Vibrio sp. SCSIO 43136]
MLSLVEKIRSGYLWDFHGGVHPPENKQQSVKTSLSHAPLANEFVLPLKQHIGKSGDICVEVGQKVLRGQRLTDCPLSFMLPVHAPTSGTVTAIEPRTSTHPSGLAELSIVITADGKDKWFDRQPMPDYQQETAEILIETIRQAGVSGMGGAGFPTAKKIQSGMAKTKILIINAAECEPYITADDILMREHADEIIQGIDIIEHILKPELTIIAVEDNKPEAVKALEVAATQKDLVIRVIPTKYPSGGEKQLIKILTNQEVPKNGIPADIGVLVQNVGSVQAVKKAIIDGEPLTERVVTLTGNCFKQPQNVWTRIGTPIQFLLDQFDYQPSKKSPRLILGGPMMGFTLPHTSVPITKTTNCILAPTHKEIPANRYEMECIRCSSCAEVCPANLLPQQLQWYAKDADYQKCEELNLKDCIECGACAYVCPSEIPLVEYYRQAKAEIRTQQQEAQAAERAKARFEERNARLEREKAERENRFKKAAEQRRKEMKATGGDDAVAAAIERVKAQKAQPDNAPKPAVAAAIARAKAKQAEAAKSNAQEPDNSEMIELRKKRKEEARLRKAKQAQEQAQETSESENATEKKDAVAAAIARAKAKKAAQVQTDNDSPADSTDKKDAVAAAIARAKARKAAQQTTDTQDDTTNSTSDDSSTKKDAVAAAIARAKARKAAQENTQPQDEAEQASEAAEDPKKAAVAAAIARAKARKATQDSSEPLVETEQESEAAEDPKKAAVAAAIARAKARKAAQENSEPLVETEQESEAAEDPKKAAVAAAIARAKARKAAQENTDPQIEAEQEADATEDPKKAAVAAAIARAKARKAAQENTEPQIEAEQEAEPAEDPKKAAVAAAIARAKARKAAQENAEPQADTEQESEPETQEDPKKAAVAAAIARAKARKAAMQQKQTKENE